MVWRRDGLAGAGAGLKGGWVWLEGELMRRSGKGGPWPGKRRPGRAGGGLKRGGGLARGDGWEGQIGREAAGGRAGLMRACGGPLRTRPGWRVAAVHRRGDCCGGVPRSSRRRLQSCGAGGGFARIANIRQAGWPQHMGRRSVGVGGGSGALMAAGAGGLRSGVLGLVERTCSSAGHRGWGLSTICAGASGGWRLKGDGGHNVCSAVEGGACGFDVSADTASH
jgi:hypothetical protein